MALDFQSVSIPFSEGLDTKTDEKLVVHGKLIDLQNGVFTEGNKIRKRFGSIDLGNKDNDTGIEFTSGDALSSYKDELIEFTSDRLYSYSSFKDAWINKGTTLSYETTSKTIIDNNYSQTQQDLYTLGGVTVIAWKDGRGGIRATVIDENTKANFLTDVSLSSTGTRPRVIGIGQYIFVWFADSSNLRYRRLNIANPNSFETQFTVKTDLHATNSHYDVGILGNAFVVTYNDDTTDIHIFYWLPITQIIGTNATGHGDEVSLTNENAENCLNIYILIENIKNRFPVIAWHNGNNGVRTTVRNDDLTSLVAPVTLDNFTRTKTQTFVDANVNVGTNAITLTSHPFISNDRIQLTTTGTLPAGLSLATNYYVIFVDVNTIKLSLSFGPGPEVDITGAAGGGTHTVTFQDNKVVNITGVRSAENTVKWFYEAIRLQTYHRFTRQNTITTGGVVGTAAFFLRGVGLSLEAFTFNSRNYLGVVHDSTLQPTYFLVNESGVVIGKWHQGQAQGVTEVAKLPRTSSPSTNFLTFASLKKGRLQIENSVFFNLSGVYQTNFHFNHNNKFSSKEIGESLHTAGSLIYQYDGTQVVEHGFHVFPHDLVTRSQTTGGSMSNGTYQLSAVYEWMDARGQRHRSSPSIPVSITLSGGGSAQQINVDVPTLRITEKTNVTVHLYSTENNGTLFYRVTSVTSPTFNDESVDIVTLTRTIADATLIGNELIYTTGGLLENIAPFNASIITTHLNRIYTAGLENENEIQFSQPFIPGDAIAFNDTLLRRVNQEGGRITALESMDDKLVIFKESRIYAQSGFGPNLSGLLSDFSDPTLITTDLGCSEPKSVILMPLGIMFKGDKGIYILTRSLDAQYIGADVEDFNDEEITSAILLDDLNEVRFTTQSGRALVYNYYYQQWSTFTNYEAESGATFSGTYCHLKSNGKVRQETTNAFLDNGQFYKLFLETAWLKFAGLQGFQRARRLSLLGEYRSDHKLNIGLFYDYEEFNRHTIIFNATNVIPSGTWGSDVTWGSSSFWGGNGTNGVYQMRAHLPRQKCHSVKFTFEDEASTANIGESFSLSDLTIEVGIKRGISKVESSKSV